MKSKISKVLLVLLSAVLALGIASCAPQDPKKPEQPEEPAYWEDHSAVVEGEAESSLFPEFPAVQQLDCVEYDFGNSNVYDSPDIFNEVATLSCLQGLALKSGATRNIYLNVLRQAGHKAGWCGVWLDEFKQKDGVQSNEVTGTEQKSAFEILLEDYAGYVTEYGGKPGYVLYEQSFEEGIDTDGNQSMMGSETLNAAFTVAAATGYLPVDVTKADIAERAGYVMAKDVREYTERQAYEEYADELSKSYIILTPNNTVENRDLGIALGALYVDEAYKSDSFRSELKNAYPNDGSVTVMGWASYNEVYQIKNHGTNGFGFLCTVYNYNLTVSVTLGGKCFEPRTQDEDIEADPDKHYVALVMTDGDNLSWHQNSFAMSEEYFGYSLNKELRSKNPFKMGWTIAPSMADLMPQVLRYEYEKGSPYDYFVAAPSGAVTMYPTQMSNKHPEALENALDMTDEYMRRCGISYTEILNDADSAPELPFDDTVMEKYAARPHIKGGFVMANTNKYIQGGDLRWYNDKPFLGYAESFWSDTPGRVAYRLNSLPADIHSVNGYTAVKIHCWSTTMTDVANMVSRLDDHIEIVSPGELMRLIEENVPHENAERTIVGREDYPENVDEYVVAETMFNETPLNEKSEFYFDVFGDYEGWQKYKGSRTYDYVSFSGEKWEYNPLGVGKQSADGGDGYSIRFDGSDYGLHDEQPNGAIYSKFYIFDSAKARFEFQFKSAIGEFTADFRVRAIQKTEDGYIIKNLRTGRELEDSTYTRAGSEWTLYRYDLSLFRGQEIVLMIEYNPVEGEAYVDNIKLTF